MNDSEWMLEEIARQNELAQASTQTEVSPEQEAPEKVLDLIRMLSETNPGMSSRERFMVLVPAVMGLFPQEQRFLFEVALEMFGVTPTTLLDAMPDEQTHELMAQLETLLHWCRTGEVPDELRALSE